MRKLIGRLCCFLPLALIVGLINYCVDPANIYHAGQLEDEIGRHLARGRNVIIHKAGVDDRLLQKSLALHLEEAPDCVVFGSSRSMQITAAAVGTEHSRSFLNASVSSASLEDHVALDHILRKRHAQRPRLVIVGADPWIFTRNHLHRRWKSVQADFTSGVNKLRLSDGTRKYFGGEMHKATFFIKKRDLAAGVSRITNLFSPTYLQASLRQLHGGSDSLYVLSDHVGPTEKMIWEASGSRLYPAGTGGDSREVESLARRRAEITRSFSGDGQDALDPDYQQMFEALVDQFQQDGSAVVLWLAPYHPLTVKKMRPDVVATLEKTEAYLQDVSRQRGLTVIGSYHPERCSFGRQDFYDGIHPKREAVARRFNRSWPRVVAQRDARQPL